MKGILDFTGKISDFEFKIELTRKNFSIYGWNFGHVVFGSKDHKIALLVEIIQFFCHFHSTLLTILFNVLKLVSFSLSPIRDRQPQ